MQPAMSLRLRLVGCTLYNSREGSELFPRMRRARNQLHEAGCMTFGFRVRFDEADSTEFDKPSEAEAYSCIQLCLGGQGVLLPKLRPLTVMDGQCRFSYKFLTVI